MKHFIVKLNGIRSGEGVELKNGSVIVEFDGASGSIQYVTLDAFKKSHAKAAQEDPTLVIEWTETDTDVKLTELTKLVQQVLVSMPRNYTYTYPVTWHSTNINEETIKRNTINALASALKNISKLQFYPGADANHGPNWLAAELYEQGIVASKKVKDEN